MFLNLAGRPQNRAWRRCLGHWTVAFGLLLAVGCGSAPPPSPRANQMVYYDRATQTAVVYKASRETATIHPKTGKPTLVPASYCWKCQKWFPAPPIEVLQRNPKAAVCPKGHALTPDGPWPDEVLGER